MSAAVLAIGLLAASLPSSILLEMRCHSELGTSSITLFDRGAVRRAEGTPGQHERVWVRELAADELAAYLQRIAEVDLREVPESLGVGRGAEGAWIDQCELALQLRGTGERRYLWRRVDASPLGLSNLVRIVEELAEGGLEIGASRLPDGYVPREGDVLRRRDGVLFRVISLTSDKQGLELHGVDQPLVVFIPLGALGSELTELVESRAGNR